MLTSNISINHICSSNGCHALFASSPGSRERSKDTAKSIASLIYDDPVSLVIAGGGTGGHLFPGLAIAEELLAADDANRVMFIGTGNLFETTVLKKKGVKHERIEVDSLKGKPLLQQLHAMLSIPKSIFKSMAILRKYHPDVVLGMGGFSAGPVVIGAWLMGIQTALHEQNVLPGITNRILARFADRIYVSFEQTKLKASKKKIKVTGNPVRKEILSLSDPIVRHIADSMPAEDRFTILVLGGSQGAHGVNMAVIEALQDIRAKEAYAFIHQTGDHDEAVVKKAYAENNISSTVKPFFNDMEKQYQKADLVICRAGATTIAELTVLGKGVIFIPYPFAADNHQALNAQSLVDAGAAEMIREENLTGKILAEKIASYASSPEKITAMASNARRLGRPGAAKKIVEDIYHLKNH